MSDDVLRIYLNDHLAGATAAIDLLQHLTKLRPESDAQQRYARLRREIEEDKQVLQNILTGLGGTESPVRKAAGWLSGKLGQVKMAIDDTGDDQLRVLEALEALSLGIQGKLSLWRALATVASRVPPLQSVDFGRLQQRASEQFEQVDGERLQVAKAALAR
jgi:hypothetical protein